MACRILEALPLPIFLVYMTAAEPTSPLEWRGPYFASAALAVLGSVIVIVSGLTLNRIYLGLALYFITGALGLALGARALNEFYGRAEATAMLYWILLVGMATAFTTRSGFLAYDAATDAHETRRYSFILIAIVVAAIAFSWAFHGNPATAAYAPFVTVFAAHAILRARLARLTAA